MLLEAVALHVVTASEALHSGREGGGCKGGRGEGVRKGGGRV